jgi:hypothetical protein
MRWPRSNAAAVAISPDRRARPSTRAAVVARLGFDAARKVKASH